MPFLKSLAVKAEQKTKLPARTACDAPSAGIQFNRGVSRRMMEL
jgi:hypothetical protein